MPIVLTLERRAGPGARETRTLSGGTLSIGRGPGNDWVLADPDRHLSKTHCMVSREGGRWYVTDLSTNGLYVNGAREATRRDMRLELTDGDNFRLGDYEISVAETTEREAATPVRAASAELADPLGGDLLDDPFGEAPASHAAFHHPLPRNAPAPRMADPFDEVDQDRPQLPTLDDDFFRGPGEAEDWSGPSQPDHVDAPFQAFVPQKTVSPASLDDFDFDALLGDTPPDHVADPFAASAARPADPAPAVVPPRPAASPAAHVPPAPAPVAPAPVQPAQSSPADHAGALAAFLAGAGVPELRTGRDAEATLHAAGIVFRAMVEGIREVLMSRSAIKNELRVEQTMMRARDNNALKFSVTPEEALAALLLPERTGYKPALAATREAFADVRSHEMAVMAGMQTALLGLLRRFDPAALEARLQPGRLDSILPAARRARIWELFCATYKDIAREAEDDFQSVFGREFARAYDAQMKKL